MDIFDSITNYKYNPNQMDSDGNVSDAAKFHSPSRGSHGNQQTPATAVSTAAAEEENIQSSSIQYYMENRYPKVLHLCVNILNSVSMARSSKVG